MVKNACLIKWNVANANTSFGQKQLSFVIETKRILIFFITLEYVYKYVWHGMEQCKSCIGNTALGVLLLQFYSSVHLFFQTLVFEINLPCQEQ